MKKRMYQRIWSTNNFFLIRNSPERSENQRRWCLLLFFLFIIFMKRNFLCKVAITVITFIILARSKANEINQSRTLILQKKNKFALLKAPLK